MPADVDDVVMALTYYTPYVSGLTNAARDVAEGLAARGRRVTVVTTRHDPALPEREVINGVRVLRAPVLAKLGKGTVSTKFTSMVVEASAKAKVLNAHLPMLEAGLVTHAAKCPVVLTYQCDVSLPPGALNALQGRVVDASSRHAMKKAAMVAVSSEDYARHSRMWPYIAPRMVAIPPPCTPAPGGSPAYRDGEGFHVGFLGRIVEEKGVEFLVDGFRALDDPDARLLIGGDFAAVAGGSVVERVRAHIADDPRIKLLGFIPDEKLPDFYASLDAFALPSVNAFEAFGIVQVVAMLEGVPVLASDLPGVRTPVRSTGFGKIVTPRDVRGITAALEELRDERPDPAVGAAKARELYGLEAVIDAYETLFEKVAGQ